MNILYIGSFRMPNKDAAAARVLNNARAMKMLGHNVMFISWGGEYRDVDLCDDGIYRIDGMKYIITNELDVIGSLVKKIRSVIKRGEKSMKIINTLSKPDLIILYNADKNWSEKLLKYCYENNIFLANDITEWYDNKELRIWNIIPYYINMTHTQYRIKNKILISSYLNDYYAGSNNLLLPPLCDQNEEKWSKKIIDKRIPPFSGVTLLYAGNPAKKDCVHIVVNVVNELAKKNNAIRFIMIGSTKEDYISHFKAQINDTMLHENIIFLGKVSQDLVPAYYKFADFMVLLREPSRKNMAGFPTKFAEAFSASVPVIANETSDLGKYISDGSTGFIVNTPTIEDLKNILVSKVLSMSQEEIKRMKQNVQLVQSKFDYRSYMNQINRFLNNLN